MALHEAEPLERYVCREGRLAREVERRDGSLAVSDCGPAPKAGSDLGACADQRFLRLTELPEAPAEVEAIRVADLFSGCGALSLGVREAARALGSATEVVLAADLERAPLEVFAESFGAEAAIRQVDLAEVLNGRFGERRTDAERVFLRGVNKVDITVAGPPCQGHSALNNHTRHDDDRNDLYLRVVRFAELCKPRFCLIENVATVERDQRRTVTRAVELLAGLGYSVDHCVVRLDELGVPQSRKRHVLVASRRGEPTIEIEGLVERASVASKRTVAWAIGDLAGVRDPQPFDRPSRPTRLNKHRMRVLHKSGQRNLDNRHRPPCHREPKPDRDGVLREHSYKSMYGRLDWDEPAQTVTSGYGSMGQGRYVHPARPRTITPHEAARLQMFPDFYRFDAVAGRGEWARMIGNAAPMKLSYVLALEMLR